MDSKLRFTLLSTAAVLAAYALALVLDLWMVFLRERAMTVGSPPALILWTWSLGNLILAAVVFGVYERWIKRIDGWPILLVIFSGLLFNFIPVFYFEIGPGLVEFVTDILAARAFIVSTGALMAVAGMIQLGRRIAAA
jgi:hypothetical protein